MSSDWWAEEILDQLTKRDEIEQKDRKYFDAFKQLADRLDKDELSPPPANVVEKVNELAAANEKLEEKLRKSTKVNTALEKQIASLKIKVHNLLMEIGEKNKSIEIINDELLSHNIQQNVLKRRVEHLENENETLVQRWIDKAEKDAEKLNDVNEFLEKVNMKS